MSKIRINKSGFESRKAAQEARAIAYNEYFRTGRKQKIKDMSYEDYLDYWITNYCYFNVKYSTIASYINIIKNHLKAELEMYKLTQLDSYTIQNYINKLYKEKHYSKHYLKGILKLIKGSLKYACYTVIFINDNPAERVHIPKYDVVTGDPAHIFTQEKFEIILERIKKYLSSTGSSSFLRKSIFSSIYNSPFNIISVFIETSKNHSKISTSLFSRRK